MINRVTIEKLKQIDRLVFDIPSSGVHILSGANGSGKSCLLACLLRIGWSNAFQLAFRTSKKSKALDEFTGAKIKYDIGSHSVTYAYSGTRWEPTPKNHSKLLSKLGYAAVIYAAANSERIEPRAEDFTPRKVRDAELSLRNAAKLILDDDKFDNLKVINVRRGVGAEAYLILDNDRSTTKKKVYFSEKNFSLGEICVLKLLRQLENCPNRSLVLIDELELALHPRAQIGLFNYLQGISAEKELTTIFSTHSVNLIKSVDRKNLFFIDRVDGRTEVISGCYPTYALGHLALREERSPDIVLFVEDEQAQFIVDAIVKSLLRTDFASQSKPTIVVVPIGSFASVIAFLSKSQALLAGNVRQFALLDRDAYDEYVIPLKKASKHKELAKIDNVSDKINYLPWTPEVGMCALFGSNLGIQEKSIRAFFSDNRITLKGFDFKAVSRLEGGQQRRKAKDLVQQIIDEISSLTSQSPDRIRQDLSEYFAESCLQSPNSSTLKSIMMPLIKA